LKIYKSLGILGYSLSFLLEGILEKSKNSAHKGLVSVVILNYEICYVGNMVSSKWSTSFSL